MNAFDASAPCALPIFYRTYSRLTEQGRENYQQVTDRTVKAIAELGHFTEEETALVREMQENRQVLPSGRWLWTGGTEWLQNQKNFSGAYNCTSTRVTDWQSLALMMDLAMMGSGTGAVIEERHNETLPAIRNRIKLNDVVAVGGSAQDDRSHHPSATCRATEPTNHTNN